MSDTDRFNKESFDRYYKSGRGNLGEWLQGYLQTHVAAPFSMPRRVEYDLRDLFTYLLGSGDESDRGLIRTAVQDNLRRLVENSNSEQLAELRGAAIGAGLKELV